MKSGKNCIFSKTVVANRSNTKDFYIQWVFIFSSPPSEHTGSKAQCLHNVAWALNATICDDRHAVAPQESENTGPWEGGKETGNVQQPPSMRG